MIPSTLTLWGSPCPLPSDQKRSLVKRLYFNPKKASTIQPITDDLRKQFCNITKRDVTRILKTFETYQRNFMRHRPPKVLGRMVLTQPGILACDMFFPENELFGGDGHVVEILPVLRSSAEGF